MYLGTAQQVFTGLRVNCASPSFCEPISKENNIKTLQYTKSSLSCPHVVGTKSLCHRGNCRALPVGGPRARFAHSIVVLHNLVNIEVVERSPPACMHAWLAPRWLPCVHCDREICMVIGHQQQVDEDEDQHGGCQEFTCMPTNRSSCKVGCTRPAAGIHGLIDLALSH